MSSDTSDHTGDSSSNYLTYSLEQRTVYWAEPLTDVDLKIKRLFTETKWSAHTLVQFWGLDQKKSVLSCISKPYTMQNEVELDQSYRVMAETDQYSTNSLLYKVMSHGLPKVIMIEENKAKCRFISTGEEFGLIGFVLIPIYNKKEGCIGIIEGAVRNTRDIFSSYFDFVVALKGEKDLMIFNKIGFAKDLADEYGTPADVSRLEAISDEIDDEDNIPAGLTKEYLTQQLGKNITPMEIAKKIKCTDATVRNHIKNLKIPYTKYKRASFSKSKTETDTSMKK